MFGGREKGDTKANKQEIEPSKQCFQSASKNMDLFYLVWIKEKCDLKMVKFNFWILSADSLVPSKLG